MIARNIEQPSQQKVIDLIILVSTIVQISKIEDMYHIKEILESIKEITNGYT